MAASPLTPEQQAALDTFTEDAQTAAKAHTAKMSADADLATATLTQQSTTSTDIADHQKALASAQAFIDLMVPPSLPATPQAAASGKK